MPGERPPLIIEHPELQNLLQRYGGWTVTVIGWLLWIYLVLPLLALGAWVLGIDFLYRTLVLGLEREDFIALLGTYGTGIALLATVYLGWAVYSYLRWRHVERRRSTRLVDDETLRKTHGLDPESFAALRSAQRLTLSAERVARLLGEAPERNGR